MIYITKEIIDSLTTEQNIISCILKKPRLLYDVRSKIDKSFFDGREGRNHNRAIFAVLEFLSQEKDIDELEFDAMTLYSISKRFNSIKKVFKNIFGKSDDFIRYIEMLRRLPVDVKNLDYHINELVKINLTNEIRKYHDEYEDKLIKNYGTWELNKIISEAESGLLRLSNQYSTTGQDEPEQIGEGLVDDYKSRKPNPNGFVGLPTPFPALNKLTNGVLRKGSVTVINANSGVGKSMLLKNIAKYIGVDLKKPVYWGANEQTKREQKDRLLAEMCGLPIGIIENGLYNSPTETIEFNNKEYITEDIKNHVFKQIDILEKAPIFIDQIQGYNSQILVQRAKYFHTRHNIECFIWDYVKESAGLPSSMPLRHALADVVLNLKENIADPLQIPVITASQAKVYEYWLSNESYGIEKFCTAFLLLRKLTDKERASNPLMGEYALTVKKNRYGREHDNYENQWISLDLNSKHLRFKQVG
ncbi:MAG: DnaB-like helicase C-terminal domain-containing protein [bacterium]